LTAKYAELSATSALLGSQLSRIFSGLTTAYLITFLEYFAFYSVIIGMAYWQSKKEQSHTTKDELQGRAFDNQNLLLSLAILRY
jgi:hypothetical protein